MNHETSELGAIWRAHKLVRFWGHEVQGQREEINKTI